MISCEFLLKSTTKQTIHLEIVTLAFRKIVLSTCEETGAALICYGSLWSGDAEIIFS